MRALIALAAATMAVAGAGPVVPPGHVAVAGDNTGRSQDSRHLGYIPLTTVLGRPLRVICPGEG